jgi:cytochrome d ubiquinol oxidase subunit II
MWINIVWYILFVIIISGYLILDGFDLGVGILHLFIAKKDEERRITLNSIGPIWDGNEVWLILGGGVLFAAFPLVYASLFAGFYGAMMLVLLFLILRTVAIEFRSKRPGSGWRKLWDVIFFLASLFIALLLGVAFGNVLGGVPLDAQGNIQAFIPSLLTPFALLVGLTTIAMLTYHGGIYLAMKTDGELLARIKRSITPLMITFFILNTVVIGVILLWHQEITSRYLAQPWWAILPAAALAAIILAWWMVRKERYFVAFLASSVMIALLILSAAAGLYPDLLISTINPEFNQTIFNAASEANTLTVMLIIAAIGMPFVLLYTAGLYYIFRGKVKLGPSSY